MRQEIDNCSSTNICLSGVFKNHSYETPVESIYIQFLRIMVGINQHIDNKRHTAVGINLDMHLIDAGVVIIGLAYRQIFNASVKK